MILIFFCFFLEYKNRISILFCTNATGNHKFRPLVIGKASNPRCFKNFNKSALSVTYRANFKAWMRSDIFVEWLNHLDYYFRTLNRKILLIIDNAGSHFNPKRFEKNDDDDEISDEENSDQQSNKTTQKIKAQQKKIIPNLTNIELVYLPPTLQKLNIFNRCRIDIESTLLSLS